MLLKLMALVTAVVHMVSSQDRGGTILHQGAVGDTQSVIVTARTTAFLSCESGDIVVKVNFTQPFRGLMYAHRSRTSPCKVHGRGGHYYELRIPLKGCGTWQETPRMFVNNITIRFHSALELEDDETKTVVCRYPPPLTQPPGTVKIIEPVPITPTSNPTRVSRAGLSEVEILIIICLLLFLSLLSLGLGIAYFCLKRRNIRVIRKSTAAFSSAPPSQITRLSSSNFNGPSSSVLSSVLGHTVRIPRAVPYSAPAGRVGASPDHNYEDYPASSSEATSPETSVSSSSMGEDQVDASRNLLYRKVTPKSILSIPKAILRKAGSNRWRTTPTVHEYAAKSDSTFVKKRIEMEDQTVTTVLEPENHFEGESDLSRERRSKQDVSKQSMHLHTFETSAKSNGSFPTTKPSSAEVPVYAQVDKHKKTLVTSKSDTAKATEALKRLAPVPTSKRLQQQVIIETPEVSKTTEDVTKNTTVTTSVRREIKETRILPPMLDSFKAGFKKEESSIEASSRRQRTEQASALIAKVPGLNLQNPAKSILVRNISDIYLTTTVETEFKELTTKVAKDTIQQHNKPKEVHPEIEAPKEKALLPSKSPVFRKVPLPKQTWNVIIRQREPPVSPTGGTTDLDASIESNADTTEEEKAVPKPHFDVKIRTTPPNQNQPKKSNEMVSIPPLEMPATVSMLREALKPAKPEEKVPEKATAKVKDQEGTVSDPSEDEGNILPPRTVRWKDGKKPSTSEAVPSTSSSTESFQSSESLRERSSSEVLEIAPTLPSHPPLLKGRSMLERSTSEIVTSPEDHSKWVGGVVPVLESLSPEFLANIPVVIQGGFFNRQRSVDKRENTKDA